MVITQKREDLAAHIARHLGLNPHEPNDWPQELVERIMRDMDRAARDVLDTHCRSLMTKPTA